MSKRKNTLTDRVKRAEQRAQLERHRLVETAAKRTRKGIAAPRGYLDSYDATHRGRNRVGYYGRAGSHDQHLDPQSHDLLRRDARKLDRNNALARSLIRRHCDAVIGKGFTLRCESGDQEWNKVAERFWRKWYTDEIDVQGLAIGPQFDRIVHDSACVDGDVLIVKLDNGQCQLIESDRIRQPAGAIASGHSCTSGVERDKAGRIVAFHVADTAGPSSYSLGYTQTRRIPAEFCVYMPSPQHQRVNQTRGEPVLAATIPLLEQLDDLIDASVVAQRLAAYQALVIESSDPAGMQSALEGGSEAQMPGLSTGYNGGAPQPIHWEPGGVLHLQQGERATQVKPEHPGQNFQDQVRMLVRMIGADFGLPLELSMMDSSQANYHGFKAALETAYRGFARWQEWNARMLLNLFRWRIGRAIVEGDLPFVDSWERASFLPPAKPVIDPKAELEALAFGVNQRLTTRKDAVAGLSGSDLDDHYDQIEAEIKRETSAGIGPVTMPGQVTPATGQQPNAEATASN